MQSVLRTKLIKVAHQMNNPCFYLSRGFVDFQRFHHDIQNIRQHIQAVHCENVLLFEPDSYQFSVLLFALLLENKHVLLPPNSQEGTIAQLSQHCDSTAGEVFILDKDNFSVKEPINPIESHSLSTSRKKLFSNLAANISGKITFYTSGSTGTPKAIEKSIKQLLCEVDILHACFSAELENIDLVVSTVSHQHIYGLLFKLLLPLKFGIIIVTKTFEYPEHISHHLSSLVFDSIENKHKKLMLVSSPAHLKRLVLDNVLASFAGFYSVTFSSGGVLPLDTSMRFNTQMGAAPIEVYGSTETGGIAWRKGQQSTDAPWKMLPELKYQISDDQNRLMVFSPYVNEQPYLTDDRVELLSDNTFILRGRVDRIVKIEEKRVNLGHIESCLGLHAWVKDAKVFVLNQTERSRQILVCALALSHEGMAAIKKQGKREINTLFKQHLLNDFERICLPKKWRYEAVLPYNSQGKLSLIDLEKLFA